MKNKITEFVMMISESGEVAIAFKSSKGAFLVNIDVARSKDKLFFIHKKNKMEVDLTAEQFDKIKSVNVVYLATIEKTVTFDSVVEAKIMDI